MDFKMFMAHIPHENIDYVEETLKGYDIGQYIISLETTKYEHMHFIVEMTIEDYHRFSKRVFKDKFKLRGRAIKGEPRQYGIIKKIENIENAKAYTVKDGNVRTNLDQAELEKYLEQSFKKAEDKCMIDEIVEELENRYAEAYMKSYNEVYIEDVCFNRVTARYAIIDIMREKGLKSISRNKVENILYRYMMKQSEEFVSTKEIYEILYPMG